MPKLWDDTIDAHRSAVRDAILDTAAALVAERGLRAVTMSQIARDAGIGRATLYKYFPDVETMLLAWHERQVAVHVEQLGALRDGPGSALERLAAVLNAYATLTREHDDAGLAAALHRGEHVDQARRHLHALVRGLLDDGRSDGAVRSDVASDELAAYCLSAVGAARTLGSKAAVRRVVGVTVDGLRAPG